MKGKRNKTLSDLMRAILKMDCSVNAQEFRELRKGVGGEEKEKHQVL